MYLSRFRHPAFNCHHSITAISEETPSALKNVMCKTRTLQMMPVVFSQGKKKASNQLNLASSKDSNSPSKWKQMEPPEILFPWCANWKRNLSQSKPPKNKQKHLTERYKILTSWQNFTTTSPWQFLPTGNWRLLRFVDKTTLLPTISNTIQKNSVNTITVSSQSQKVKQSGWLAYLRHLLKEHLKSKNLQQFNNPWVMQR